MLTSNKSMMQLFRKYLLDIAQRVMLNKFSAYLDARTYMSLSDSQRKGHSSHNLLRTYLQSNSKKNILPLSERLQTLLKSDMQRADKNDSRPRSPFIGSLAKELRAALEDHFQKFCEQQAAEHMLAGAEQFASLSQTELLVLLGDSYNTKEFDFDDEKVDGKVLPTKDDRVEFTRLLQEWAMGKSCDTFYGLYAHLTEHGRKDGLPFLEKV